MDIRPGHAGIALALAACCGLAGGIAGPSHSPHSLAGPDRPECTVCFVQREGSTVYALQHLFGLADADADVRFGHCIACVTCEGDQRPTCTGFWSDDPDSTGLLVEPGSVMADGDEDWDHGACYFTTKEVGEAARRAARDVPPEYQVLGLGGTSCLTYCADIAQAIGVGVRSPFGSLTVPGDLQWTAPHHNVHQREP